jgi:hypothetical protein
MSDVVFDRAHYEQMNFRELRPHFKEIVGEEPSNPNMRWMLRRMEEVFSARQAVRRAVEHANETAAAAVPTAAQEPPVASTATEHVEPKGGLADLGEEDLEDPEEDGVESSSDATGAGSPGDERSTDARSAAIAGPPESDASAETTPVDPNGAGIAASAGDDASTAPRLTDATPQHGTTLSDDNANRQPEPVREPQIEEAGETSDASDAAAMPTASRKRYIPRRFQAMSLADIQRLYLTTIGRSTNSSDVPYLAWKIKEAEKGRIPVGPRRTPARRRGEPTETPKVLSLRVREDALTALDAAVERLGYRSRMAFFAEAAGRLLSEHGETDAAAHFMCAPDDAQA